MTKYGGQFALASPTPDSGGTRPPFPRHLRPCVYSVTLYIFIHASDDCVICLL